MPVSVVTVSIDCDTGLWWVKLKKDKIGDDG